MDNSDIPQNEQERIRSVYRRWIAEQGDPRANPYAWHRPDVMAQHAARLQVAGTMLADTVGPDLGRLRIIDVGCGSGGFLRQLINWGANPALLAGTEYQQERLDEARLRSAAGVRWHLGDLDFTGPASADLIIANTVFSSILAPSARLALASDMWRTLAPGGWCMVFDFRYNNPRNPNVRRVARAEVHGWWPASAQRYQTLLLAPPLARRLAWAPRLLGDALACLPPLRSHFIYMARKP